MHDRIAIVGAGQAGAALAMRLRAGGHVGEIVIYGAEPHLPYQRPPLSKKYLSGEWEAERLYLRPDHYWRDAGIEVRSGEPVVAIDPAARTLRWGGEDRPWDRLALTTGARPRPRPAGFADVDGVYELRSLNDVDAMRARFSPGRRLAVVGGGFIGLETAAVAAGLGMVVTVIELAERILARVVCARTSEHFRNLHAANGVRILEGRSVSKVLGDGAVTAVELDDGKRIDTDIVLLGVGVLPETSLAEQAGLRCDNGILVDERCRTSCSGIWAAGDCAAFPFMGEKTRLESVQNAIDQAEAAADDMLGIGVPYVPVPWFWSDQYDTKLQIAGLNRGYTQVVSRSTGRGLSNWYFKDEDFIAVDCIGDAQAFMIAKRLLAGGARIDPARVADPDIQLKSLLA
ncbi:NAD(P)/FAD-dependent oxidoreductase [Microbaculum marinum]|uniref:FAD-dependent oxidoreductase n=1 Tax=Microbaculum marinum TaxID=1764581 RepID=A0AAW9RWC4_9HYPH